MAELIPRRGPVREPGTHQPHFVPRRNLARAWIAPHEGVLNVWVAPIGGNGVDWSAARVVTDDTDRGIRMFAWAHDGQHLLYLQDTGGDENWRLHDVAARPMPAAAGPDAVRQRQTAQIVGAKKFPTEILVGLNRTTRSCTTCTSQTSPPASWSRRSRTGFIGWIADAQLVVRAGIKRPDGGSVIMVPRQRSGEWRRLLGTVNLDKLGNATMVLTQKMTASQWATFKTSQIYNDPAMAKA